MALNYTTIFQRIGKLIAKSNSYAPLASTTLPADLQAINAIYGTSPTTYGDSQSAIDGINAVYAGFQSAVTGWRSTLVNYVTNTLTDTDTVISQLPGLTRTDLQSVLRALIQDMLTNSQSVKGNVVTLGTPTAAAGNVGNGTALVDATLDGYNAPLLQGSAHIRYNGLLSELAVPSETMELACTTDAASGGTEGSEQWSWVGGQPYPLFDYHNEGSGQGPGLTTAHQDTTIQNLGFENWSGNTPSNWTIESGAAGTTVFRETTTANLYRGTSALRLTGDGVTATIQLGQSVSASQLRPRRRYLFTVRLMKSGASPAGASLIIRFTGTGYTAAVSEQISTLVSGLPAAYGLYSFYWNTPATLPSDLKMVLSVTGTLPSGANVLIDSGSFSPVVYHGGVNAAIVSGSTPWAAGDRLTFTVANTTTGLFQDYFRRSMYCQLNSKTDASQTIVDSLAS